MGQDAGQDQLGAGRPLRDLASQPVEKWHQPILQGERKRRIGKLAGEQQVDAAFVADRQNAVFEPRPAAGPARPFAEEIRQQQERIPFDQTGCECGSGTVVMGENPAFERRRVARPKLAGRLAAQELEAERKIEVSGIAQGLPIMKEFQALKLSRVPQSIVNHCRRRPRRREVRGADEEHQTTFEPVPDPCRRRLHERIAISGRQQAGQVRINNLPVDQAQDQPEHDADNGRGAGERRPVSFSGRNRRAPSRRVRLAAC